jgi:hypothetical protein
LKTVRIQSSTKVAGSVADVFENLFSKNLLKVFEDLPCIPNFIVTYYKFPEPGTERTIYFSDINTARQKLITLDPKMSFCVKIDQFTAIRFYRLSEVEYQFCFCELSYGLTLVSCEYRFKLKSRISKLIFKFFLHKFMQEHIDRFLKKSVNGIS